ncbi:hypothetical protein GC169_06715 [bacterium]|nr:hypothetical protein [bacterium]
MLDSMMRRVFLLGRSAAIAVSIAMMASGAATAQQPNSRTQGAIAAQRAAAANPFAGQFVAVEAAMSPAEALKQAELLSSTLAAIAPQRAGVADVYVIAAGLWGDPVFEREASNGADILARHFSAEGRTAVLSAGAGRVERRFAASTPNNINALIGKVGGVIDPNEDLVVVFLTTHGSPDGSLAFQEVNRLGGAMKPIHLMQALNAAGIRKRVLIISACFSGAFIAPFSDPDTIVLTAAAADRTSFGCEPSRDWTFFGDAFLNRELSSGAGLVSGYDRALGTIAGWEKDQKLPPSNPQKHVGDAAAALVARIEGARAGVN